MKIRAGILIIGSLLWDIDPIRNTWREERLDIQKKAEVLVPIRYGKKSKTRKDSYTMVFSNKCYQYALGTAFVVPLKNYLESEDDIKTEAINLWAAERLGYGRYISSNWGSVAMLVNPASDYVDKIKKSWSEFYTTIVAGSRIPVFSRIKSEREIISRAGMLNIKWPEQKTNEHPVDLNLILATPTRADLVSGKRYPSAKEIALSFVRADYFEYFVNNQKFGISTFQDEHIMKYIKNSSPKHY